MKDSTQKDNAKHSFILMLFTLFSRLLGIVKARVITSAFGATQVADVINVAYYLPNNLRKIFAEGAMNTAFIPGLNSCKKKSEREKLLGLMISFQMILFSLLIVIFILFGKEIFSLISDFDNEGTLLGASLLPYFIGFLAFISLSNVLLSVLQCEKKFIAYGISPLFFSIALILSVYLLSNRLDAFSMAIGTLLGSIIQFVFTLAVIIKIKYRIKLSFYFKDERFKKILLSWFLIILSSIATLFSQQFSAYLATTLETGSATAFSSSMIFFSTPYGIVFTGIAIVAFPQLSKYFILNDENNFKKTLAFSMEGMIYLFIPATILLMVLSKEAVAVVLQNGKFTFENTILTASVLFHLLIGLTIIGLNGILTRAAIARDKTKLSVKITIFQALLDVILSFILIKNGLNIVALPIANNISFLISLIIYVILFNRIIDFKRVIIAIFKSLISITPMCIFLYFYKYFSGIWYQNGSTLFNFMYFCLICLICGILTLIMYFLLKVPILKFIKRS